MRSTHISGLNTYDYNNQDNNNFDDCLSSDKCSSDQSYNFRNMFACNQSNSLENSYPKNFFDNFSQNDQQKIQLEQQQDKLISQQNVNSSVKSHLRKIIQVNQDQYNVEKQQRIKKKLIIRKDKIQNKKNGQITQQIEEARSEIDKNEKKKAQQLKNRESAQLSRDRQKKQLDDLQNENKKLSQQVNQLVEENQELKEKLKNNICFKCQSQSSIDYYQSEVDFIGQSSPIEMRRSNSNYFSNYALSTAQLALIFCVCLIIVQMDKTKYQQFQSATPNVFTQLSKCEIPNCNKNQVVEYEIPNDYKADQNPLSLIQGIDQNNFQDDIVLNTKLLNGFGKPGSSLDLMYLQQNKQNDEIICPNSYVLLYSKDPNEKHNIINLTLTNQTNFYSAYDGQYYPLYQDGQQGQIKLTCLVLKYEQIPASQQNL
ncbi:hypothetical protein ABPG74_009047 [Tetrahymena malaccensis]